MKKIIAAACISGLFNLSALHAGPVAKKKPFSSTEILELSKQQIASMDDVRQVEAGLLGLTNSLLNLAIYGALLYGGYSLVND